MIHYDIGQDVVTTSPNAIQNVLRYEQLPKWLENDPEVCDQDIILWSRARLEMTVLQLFDGHIARTYLHATIENF